MKTPFQPSSENELELHKINLEHKRAVWATGFTGLISLATLNIKHLTNVSGAAIVGLLTIFGHAWLAKISLPKEIICTLTYYFIALGSALLSGFFAYFFQSVELETNQKGLALLLRIFACILAFISFTSLAYGSYVSVEAFTSINSNINSQ